MQLRVALDLSRRIRLAVAAHVGRDGSEARFRERGELMAPRGPGFRKAVAEDDEWSLAGLGHVHANAVRLDGAVRDGSHQRPSILMTTARLSRYGLRGSSCARRQARVQPPLQRLWRFAGASPG